MASSLCHWHNLNLTLEKPVSQRGEDPKGHHILGAQLETHSCSTHLETDLQPSHKLWHGEARKQPQTGVALPGALG